jgi:hypothetical protein
MSNGVYKTRGPELDDDFIDEYGELVHGWEGLKYGVSVPNKLELVLNPEEENILESIRYLDLMNTYTNIFMAEQGHTEENPIYNTQPLPFGPQETFTAPIPFFLGEGSATINPTTGTATPTKELLPVPKLAEPGGYLLMPPETRENLTALDYINDLRKMDELVMYESDYLKPDRIPQYEQDIFGNLREKDYSPTYIAGVTSNLFKGPKWILDMANPKKSEHPISEETADRWLLERGGPYSKVGADSIFISKHDLSNLNEKKSDWINKKYPSLGKMDRLDVVLHELGHIQKTVDDDEVIVHKKSHEPDSPDFWREELDELMKLSFEGIK